MNEFLAFDNVSHSYGPVQSLSDLSFRVRSGEIVGIIGANGAGKSTMMSIASGVKHPSAGKVTVFGSEPYHETIKQIRRCLPQELHYPSHIRVREIIDIVSAHFPKKNKYELVERLGLGRLLCRLTSELSGGERRKLGILCSLLGEPRLVLMDEPTANVDLIGQARIREIILEYFKGSDRALIFSSHSVSEVELLADRLIVLLRGKIVADAPLAELRKLTGLKKVCFKSQIPNVALKSAHSIKSLDCHYEAYGENSDDILKEIVQLDPKVVDLDVVQPSLEDTILHLWGQEKQS